MIGLKYFSRVVMRVTLNFVYVIYIHIDHINIAIDTAALEKPAVIVRAEVYINTSIIQRI